MFSPIAVVFTALLVSGANADWDTPIPKKPDWYPFSIPNIRDVKAGCLGAAFFNESAPAEKGSKPVELPQPFGSFPTLVCDPDKLFTADEYVAVASTIRSLLDVPVTFQCPCKADPKDDPKAPPTCLAAAEPQKFIVALIVVKAMSMQLVHDFQKIPGEGDAPHKAAQKFADFLGPTWFKNETPCGSVFTIFYSEGDGEHGIIRIGTGPASERKIPKDRLRRISRNGLAAVQDDGLRAGFEHFFGEFKKALQGNTW